MEHFKRAQLHSVSELFFLGCAALRVELSFAETMHQFYASDGNSGAPRNRTAPEFGRSAILPIR